MLKITFKIKIINFIKQYFYYNIYKQLNNINYKIQKKNNI